MEQALRLVTQYQWWAYGLLGFVLLFYLRRAIVARRDSVRSLFKLEQEQARGRYARSVIVAAIALLIVLVVFGVTNFFLPTLNPPVEPTPTATTGPLVAPTLTPTAAPATITPTATPTVVRPTRSIPPTPTSEAVVTSTPVPKPAACPNPNVRIISPGAGQPVRGNVPVRGSADIASFQYYKVEVGPGSNPRDHEWTVIGQLHYSPVSAGALETFNSDAYPVGPYTIRLVVVDQTGNYPEPCRVTVAVQR